MEPDCDCSDWEQGFSFYCDKCEERIFVAFNELEDEEGYFTCYDCQQVFKIYDRDHLKMQKLVEGGLIEYEPQWTKKIVHYLSDFRAFYRIKKQSPHLVMYYDNGLFDRRRLFESR